MVYYVYIVKCNDDSLYTGISKDVVKRVEQHNISYLGAKALRGKRPVTLVHKETCNSKSDALKRELEIKGWPRKKKQQLIKSDKNEINPA